MLGTKQIEEKLHASMTQAFGTAGPARSRPFIWPQRQVPPSAPCSRWGRTSGAFGPARW